jgi:hypothetical protein
MYGSGSDAFSWQRLPGTRPYQFDRLVQTVTGLFPGQMYIARCESVAIQDPNGDQISIRLAVLNARSTVDPVGDDELTASSFSLTASSTSMDISLGIRVPNPTTANVYDILVDNVVIMPYSLSTSYLGVH